MKSIAITGISGYIGSRLLLRLSEIKAVERIVGIDIKPPSFNPPKLKFYQQNIFQPLSDVFLENGVEDAVHFAFVLKPTRDRAGTQQIDVGGSRNFLKACEAAKVKHILYLSSHTVYGAHPDNPVPLTEDSLLRPMSDFQYSWDKVEPEKILSDYVASHAQVCVTILRSCPVVGPNAASSVAALMFKPPVMIGVCGYDPPMQFVHEQDIIELITDCISQGKAGIYNVAGDGEVRYSDVARLAHRRMLKLPERLLNGLMAFSWTLHLQNDSPPSGLEFIKYPPVVSTEKLKKETGFRFRHSSEAALFSFLSSK